MWDLIVSVPDHCLSFYFTNVSPYIDHSAVYNFFGPLRSEIIF